MHEDEVKVCQDFETMHGSDEVARTDEEIHSKTQRGTKFWLERFLLSPPLSLCVSVLEIKRKRECTEWRNGDNYLRVDMSDDDLRF